MIVGATPSATAATAPLHVMDLAGRHATWASVRQAVIAGNIANANTPNYKARDIEAFDARRDRTQLQMSSTSPAHMALGLIEMAAADVDRAESWQMKHSGNDVSLDEQLALADETARSHRLSLAVSGAFHRMILQSVSFR